MAVVRHAERSKWKKGGVQRSSRESSKGDYVIAHGKMDCNWKSVSMGSSGPNENVGQRVVDKGFSESNSLVDQNNNVGLSETNTIRG